MSKTMIPKFCKDCRWYKARTERAGKCTNVYSEYDGADVLAKAVACNDYKPLLNETGGVK